MLNSTSSLLHSCLSVYHASVADTGDLPVNIANGSLGRQLFALELYKHTGDSQVRADTDSYLRRIEEYCRTAPTNNYTVFYGRSGLSYLYLQLFRMKQEEKYLHRAEAIIKDFFCGDPRHLGIFDNNGLLNGTAGNLLYFLSLYDEIKSDWLAGCIKQYVTLLIGKARLSATGVYWNNYGEPRVHYGLADGNSGIAFCLAEIGRYFGNPAMAYVAGLALNHEDSLPARRPGTANDTLTAGPLGQSLARLFISLSGHRRQDPSIQEDRTLQDLADKVCSAPGLLENMPKGIINGLAGWGLAFWEAHCLSGRDSFRNAVNLITSALLEAIASGDPVLKDSRFFTGWTGVGYFLLKTIDPDPSPSFLPAGIPQPGSGLWAREDIIALDLPFVKKLLIQNNFRETAGILEKEFPAAFDAFLAGASSIQPQALHAWLNEVVSREKQTKDETGLRAVIDYEIAFCGFKERRAVPDVMAEIAFAERVGTLLKLTDGELLQEELVISDLAFIHGQEQVIDLSMPVSRQWVSSLFTTYGARSRYGIAGRFDTEQSGILGTHRLFIDFFTRPANVETAVNRILAFILSQEDHILAVLRKEFKVADNRELYHSMLSVALNSVRTMLTVGVLDRSCGTRSDMSAIGSLSAASYRS